MAPQTAVDARARRHGVGAPTGELVLDPTGTPTGMLPSELTDQRLHLRSDLVRAGIGAMGVVGQGGQAALFVSGDPGVDALPGHAEPGGNLGDLPPVHGQDCLIALLHDAELHQHGPPPARDGRCQASAGATVKDQPEPVSTISRNSVKHQVTPECPASPGTRHSPVPPAGIEPATRGLGIRCSQIAYMREHTEMGHWEGIPSLEHSFVTRRFPVFRGTSAGPIS
jgi:hypothetical protein